MKEPKDLKIVVGSPELSYWKSALTEARALVLKGKCDLQINEVIVKVAKERIEIEEKQWKHLNKTVN